MWSVIYLETSQGSCHVFDLYTVFYTAYCYGLKIYYDTPRLTFQFRNIDICSVGSAEEKRDCKRGHRTKEFTDRLIQDDGSPALQ